MTKYLESERFLVTSNDKDARKRYNENYDRIFGEKTEHVEGCIVPNCPGCDDGSPERALTYECGCASAVVRNCPYANDVNNDDEQRCKCCDACAHECAMDI
jgi:hypothetical protein